MIMLKFLWLLIIAISASLVSGCDSKPESEPDEPETPLFPKDPFDYPADEIANYDYIYTTGVIIHGEFHDTNENPQLLEQLLAQSELQPTNVIEVSLPAAGKLEKLTREYARIMDKLIVSGPINLKDLYYIRDCAAFFNLRSVDLSNATIEKNTIPPLAFTKSMYHNDKITLVMLPIFNIDLPENLEHIRMCAFRDMLRTSIKFPASLKTLEAWCFMNTVLLGGDIIIPEGTEYIDTECFDHSGDHSGNHIGHISIPSSVKSLSNKAFNVTYAESISLSEGLEDIMGNSLPNNIETLILPSTLKVFFLIWTPTAVPHLKEIYCLPSTPPYAAINYPEGITVYVAKDDLQKYTSDRVWS
ncbi:MAG: leucine-rich repeat domain-containing protein, partial [Muribaculaceae bacterium]|nr:leucine-rich repeat domain-containing protein [Muribaculaceae bacterium]